MSDEATLAKAIERTKDVIDHCEGLRIEKAAGQNVVRTMFHRDSDIRILIAAARERDGLRAELASLRSIAACGRCGGVGSTHTDYPCPSCRGKGSLHDQVAALSTALESQRQATEEAMRRAEEARWQLAEVRAELDREVAARQVDGELSAIVMRRQKEILDGQHACPRCGAAIERRGMANVLCYGCTMEKNL